MGRPEREMQHKSARNISWIFVIFTEGHIISYLEKEIYSVIIYFGFLYIKVFLGKVILYDRKI